MARILVAGELNADLVMTGLPSLPILGQELIGDGFQLAMGSSSAITAARLSRLGAAVDFVGWVGDDVLGQFVIDQLNDFGVGTDAVQVLANTATDVTIALTYQHDRALLTSVGVMSRFDGTAIKPSLLAQYTHFHVGSFFLQTRLQEALPQLFRQAHEAGLTTSLDTGWDPYEQWANNQFLGSTLAEADFFFPNEAETRALLDGEFDPAALAQQIGGILVVKRGGDGALAVPKQGESLTVPALAVQVVDTTGAGDAFNAGFLYATICLKSGLAEALRFATACGAQAVTQVGGATGAPDSRAIWKMVNDHR